jgi:hypothetical protein
MKPNGMSKRSNPPATTMTASGSPRKMIRKTILSQLRWNRWQWTDEKKGYFLAYFQLKVMVPWFAVQGLQEEVSIQA